MPNVGIVIVSYNSADEIEECIAAASRTGAEVLVVDNASTDGTPDLARRLGVRVIANQENLGFASAVNQGIRALTCDYILLLNPDAIVLGSIEPLQRACSGKGVAAAGGKLVDAQGNVQKGFNLRRLPTFGALVLEILLLNRLWPGNPVNWKYRCYDFDHEVAGEAEQPAGAFLMIRRSAWEKLQGFDEQFYPVWFEDVDFCRRAIDQGYHVRYDPASVAKHAGGHSIRKILLEDRQFYWYRSLQQYGSKHFPPLAARGLCLAVVPGSLLRMLAGMFLERSLKPLVVYGRIMRLAVQGLFAGRKRE